MTCAKDKKDDALTPVKEARILKTVFLSLKLFKGRVIPLQ